VRSIYEHQQSDKDCASLSKIEFQTQVHFEYGLPQLVDDFVKYITLGLINLQAIYQPDRTSKGQSK